MARYAELYNGTVLEFPDDTPDEVISRVAREETLKLNPPEAPVRSTERTMGEAITDVPVSALSGVGSVLKFPGQLVSLVPGMRGVGEALSAPGEAIYQAAQGLKSEGLKVREALRSEAISEAEKDGILSAFATAITSTLKDPALITTFIGEQLPMLLPPAAAARVAQIGTGTLTAAQAARRGVTAAVGTGATMQAADVSEGAYKRTLEAGLQQGMSPEEAESAANQAARLAAVGAGATSLLAQRLPGARAIEERLARVPGTSGRLKSGFGEATSESLEEAGGQVFANLGVRTVDPTQSLTEGVGAAAGFGALGGGFFGTLLGKKAPTPLVPGQREGESIEQAVSRLVAERDALRETQLPSGILGGTELTELASRMGDDGRPLGYGLLTNYIEKTALLPDSPAKQQSIEVAESIRQRLNLENIQRQKASQTNIITGKDLMDVGFTPQDPVYRALVGKDLFKPEDAQTVIQALDNERKLDLDSERTALVGQLYEGVSNYLDTLPGSGFYAPERGTDGRGVEVSDQRRPVSETRPPEVDEGGVDSDTTISGGLDVGEEAKQPSLRFMTEKGSFYEVDESGNTARTKLSPGKGQGTTYDPHPVLYVSPENLREIQSDMIGGMGNHTPRLGYREDFETGSVFKPITSRSEIPEGAEPYVAVVNRNNGNIVGVYPAQLNPEVGLHPVEKLYKDGKSFTHLGNKITELVQDFEIVTPKLLKDLEIDIKSGVAKRVLGKKVEDVLEDLAKAAPSKKSLLGIPEAKFRQLETEAKKEKPIQKVEKEPTEEELSVKQKIEDLNKQIEGLLRQVLNKYGLKDVSLKIVKDMAAKGEFSGRLIKLADDTDNPLLDLRHETIHALKELGFFSPAQWKTLEDRAKKEWIDTYLKNVPHDKTQSRYDAYKNMFESEGLTEEGVEAALIEEAIADAFSFFAKEKAPPGLMNAIKNRMQNLFKALKEFLGTNNLTAEDIFGKIEEGKLPPVVKGKAAEETKKSLSSGVPRSTRLIMESSTPFAQNELGLRTEKPKGATGANNVRDIAQALNNQTIQNFGEITREQLSAADANDLARALADEVGYQLRATAQTGTGLGWYSNNYPKAIDRLSTRFPELQNNKTARSVFTACVAISSNGEDVTTNIKNAILMYEDVRAGKKIRQIGARRADALQRNKEKVITLLNRYGDNFTTELLKTTTVKEMNAGLRALGEKPDTSYLANTTVPVAAIYFGPKLGAFYANLMGAEGYLTMDMWWTRTMNRMRGLLMPEATQSSINKFQEMIGVPGLTRQQVVDATIPFRNKYEAQGYTTELEFLAGKKEPAKKDELPAWTEKAKLAAGNAYDQLEFEHRLEKMANTIYKNEFEMLQEAPFTGSDRAFMYKVARDAQKILKQEGIDLSLADIQAAIWYYEKRLYAKLSGRLADDIGYDEAISRSVANNRRARPSLVFPDGPNSGYVPPRRDRDTDQVRGEPEKGKLSLRSPLGFYNALMDGIQSSPTTTAPAGGWKAQIKGMINKGQVKQDEIEWSNINDYLDLQTGKVSKDDLLNYLRANGVQVEEVILGRKIEDEKTWYVFSDSGLRVAGYPTEEQANARAAQESEKYDAEYRVVPEYQEVSYGDESKYEKYTIPGGTNYQEVLLTLPNKKAERLQESEKGEFQSRHWDQPNVIAHIRLNDRTDTDGNKVLFVEEIQSDWGQEGKKKGFALSPAEKAAQSLEITQLQMEINAIRDAGMQIPRPGTAVQDVDPNFLRIQELIRRRDALQTKTADNSIPVAPFVTKTEGWLNLALKRAIVMAAEGGYDKVAFVTGEQSADRYDLSKQINQLYHWKYGDKFGVSAYDFDDNAVIDQETYSADQLEDYFGKEIAQKIINREGDVAKGYEDGVLVLSGTGLKVGGKGMKVFYNVIVPTAVKKLLPKVGGGQMVKVKIDQAEPSRQPSEQKAFIEWMAVNYPDIKKYDAARAWSMGIDNNTFVQEYYNTIKNMSQPGFDVTPEMREKVKKGLPLFSLRSQTQTSSFKQWFGDSKVVDKNGNPLVVYHGTKAFDDYGESEGEAISQFAGIPNWFAEEPYTASGYAGAEGTMYPVYLSIKNPLIITTFDMNDEAEAAYDLASRLGVDVDSLYIPKDSKAYNVVSTPQFIEAAQNAGYDGIKVKEGDYNTYAAFDPTQIKSAIGNVGTFDVTDPDIRRSLREERDLRVRWTDNRIERLLNINAYLQNGREKDTKGFATAIRPNDFLNATASREQRQRIAEETKPLDPDKLAQEDQELYLDIEPTDEEGVYQIKGHEGRHRMTALMNAGYNTPVPVVLKMRRENAETEEEVYLKPQRFRMDKELVTAPRGIFISQMIPINWDSRNELKEVFGGEADLKFSLRSNIRSQTPPQILARVDATIGFRDDVSLPRRMMNAISPRLFSEFRANAINRYNELAELDKRYVRAMGGTQLLADSSAEAAALFSDLGAGLTASALGVHDRVGGIPVYRNGVTVISNVNNTVKGPLAIFAPLAKYGDPEIFRHYQFWASFKRGSRLEADGKVTPFNDPNDIASARWLERKYPEFVSVQREWTKYNDGLVDFMEATGIITPEASAEFKAHGDYFPFYRYAEFDDVTGPRIFASIANVPVPKKLKGGEAPLGDFFENVIRNTQSAIQMGIKNIAAQKATELSVAIGEVTPLPVKPPKITPDVYRVLENGKEKYYRANDMLFINAIKSLNIPDLPFIGLLSAPANVLRNLVTKTPDFMMANMLRDSVAAWVTSGKEITPVIATLKNFGTAIAEKSPELTQLLNGGVLGGYDYAQGVEVSGKRFAKDLRKISKTRTDMEKLASPFTSIWEALEKGSAASDAATRMEVYKKTLQETGNEAEALYQALEVMNFNRKGRSAVIRILTAAVPFLNARIQGLDLLYRAGIRPFFDENATDAQMARAKTFWVRGMTIMALSAMYWAAVSDDDDWKKQEQETRDNYWILPEAGIKIPIPFEIGVMFKVIPERILEYSFGDDTGKDFLTSMKRQLVSTFAFNPIPQTFLPIVESATNHSFFTQRPIISQGMEGVAAEYQAMPTTSRAAIGLADGFNSIMDGLPPSVKKEFAVSPIKLEHLIQGYTGSMGTYALQLLDYIIGSNSEIPSAETRFERMPVIRRFLVDPQARGQVTAYYDLKNATDEVVRTSNYLERTANYEDLSRFMSDNYQMLANKDYIRDLEKTMKEFREMKVMIQSSRMSRESKRSALDSIEKMELQLTKNISFLKK